MGQFESQIRVQSMHDVILHAALSYERQGVMDYESALEQVVIILTQQNKELMDMIETYLRYSSTPIHQIENVITKKGAEILTDRVIQYLQQREGVKND